MLSIDITPFYQANHMTLLIVPTLCTVFIKRIHSKCCELFLIFFLFEIIALLHFGRKESSGKRSERSEGSGKKPRQRMRKQKESKNQ
tara:strand:- start:2930 stop:3190 length:261 start_codon:yes stop_codon:yes gene_type:complete